MINSDKVTVSVSVKREQKHFWLKLIGMALLVHIMLIAISIFEVFIYSYLINPGQSQELYNTHAQITGPWISGIFGSVFMFLLVKRYIKKFGANLFLYSIALPVVYIVTDVMILILAGANVFDHPVQLISANGVKVIAALAAYYIYKPKG